MFRKIMPHLQKSVRKTVQSTQSLITLKNTNSDGTIVDGYELYREQVEEATKLQPTLKKASKQKWQRVHRTFANHGLNTNSFLHIVVENPKILSRSPNKIIRTFEHWRSCQFGDNYMVLLLTKYPFLMDIDNKRWLRKQLSLLRSFVSSIENVWKLLMVCPHIIEKPMSDIQSKVQYITDVMHIEIAEIVKCQALSKPLDDIRCRHVFLESLGLFKPHSLKTTAPNASNYKPSKNPRLYKITDTTDHTFATFICNVSLAEYEAFKELYLKEMKS